MWLYFKNCVIKGVYFVYFGGRGNKYIFRYENEFFLENRIIWFGKFRKKGVNLRIEWLKKVGNFFICLIVNMYF